jgi:tRNA dimethylallyltransferase
MSTPSTHRHCLVLLGPTAVGKTELSLRLARRLEVAIVSVDSMQVYRGMDIGTAKLDEQVRREIPHHMIDVAEPEENFSLGRFCHEAWEAIEGIWARGRRPLLVCGTPLYLKGLLWGLFEGPGASPQVRSRLQAEARAMGVPHLHRRLARVDPEAARRIGPNDLQRIERALEVYELTGEPISTLQKQFSAAPRLEHAIIGLSRERGELYQRIERRVDAMMEAGLLEEVQGLLGRLGPQAGQAVGYKELWAHLRGEVSLEEAADAVKRNTRRLAKRQITWQRHFPGVEWVELDGDTSAEGALRRCEAILQRLDPPAGFGYDGRAGISA